MPTDELIDDPLADPLIDQRARAEKMRGGQLSLAQNPFAGPQQPQMSMAGAPQPAAPPKMTREQREQELYDRINKRPDGEQYVEQAKRREEGSNRRLMLALTLGSMGGEAMQPFAKSLQEHALKESTPYEIPGGWGTATSQGVVWNEGKQRESDLTHLQFMQKQDQDAETKRLARIDTNTRAQQHNETVQAIAAANRAARGGHGGNEPLVQVFDPSTQTTMYVPRSQAKGMQPPPKGGGRIPTSELNKVNDDQGKVDQFANLIDTWKPDYGGWGTKVGNFIGNYSPVSTEGQQDQAQWWKTYQGFVNEVRHGQFGAALTPVEKAEFEKAIVTSETNPEMVTAYLQKQHTLAERARDRRLQTLQRGGYDTSSFTGGPPGAAPGAAGPTAAGGAGGWGIVRR